MLEAISFPEEDLLAVKIVPAREQARIIVSLEFLRMRVQLFLCEKARTAGLAPSEYLAVHRKLVRLQLIVGPQRLWAYRTRPLDFCCGAAVEIALDGWMSNWQVETVKSTKSDETTSG